MTWVVDDGIALLRGGPFAGAAFAATGWRSEAWGATAAATVIRVPPSELLRTPRLALPELYQLFPEVVRSEDTHVIQRDDVPIYFWDGLPRWDVEPYRWDELIGPEPLLRTTMRPVQAMFEEIAASIETLPTLFSPRTAPATLLAYIAATLGTSLPAVSTARQRLFVENLVRFYRKKGTPLIFIRLFESLGFRVFLSEQYQRRGDAATAAGPQIASVATTLIVDEPVTTATNNGPYRLRFAFRPIMRGSVVVRVYINSSTEPTEIGDDGAGGWNGASGQIDYATGSGEITFSSAPIPTLEITTSYRYIADAFPDPHRRKWTDRVRSSVVSVALQPIDSSVVVTEEVSLRLESYLEMLKPAHAIFDDVRLLSDVTDTLDAEDSLPIASMIFVESVFGVVHHGYPYHALDNASQIPDLPGTGQHREGEEFIVSWRQRANGESAPYVYPWTRRGKAYHTVHPSHASQEYLGHEPHDRHDAVLTADVSPTTTTFSIANDALPAGIGVGSVVAFRSPAALRGIQREITALTTTTHHEIVVDPALPLAPLVGDPVSLLEEVALRRDGVTRRPIDPLAMYHGENAYTGDGATTVFAGFIAGILPIEAEHVLLRFIVGATAYEEVDDGLGAFSNVSTLISSASIDYGTGAFDVTFASAPDNLTAVELWYGTATSIQLGAF